jgi:hypothetical protein
MAGYEPPGTGHVLDFSETDLAGLEVTMGPLTLGAMLEMDELSEAIDAGAATPEQSRTFFRTFAGSLESWNVTSKGQPVPATFDGLLTQDAAFVLKILHAWQANVTSAPPPLPSASPAGGSPPEASLPMEALPPSPPS